MRCRFILALLAATVVWPGAAYADVVWPALIVSERLFAFLPIVVGLAAEIVALAVWIGMPWRRAVLAGVAMNAVSVLLGILLVPLSGVLWDVFPGIVLWELFALGTFNVGSWAATFVLASLTNALVETGVLRWAFGVVFSKRLVGVLTLANAASVGIAYVSLWLRPVQF